MIRIKTVKLVHNNQFVASFPEKHEVKFFKDLEVLRNELKQKYKKDIDFEYQYDMDETQDKITKFMKKV